MFKKLSCIFVTFIFVTSCFSIQAAAAEVISFEVEIVGSETFIMGAAPGSSATTPLPDGGGNTQVQTNNPNADTIDEEAYAAEVYRLLNIERERYGLAPFWRSPGMEEVAKLRSNELTSHYSHYRPASGDPFWSAAEELGVMFYGGISENIGYTTTNLLPNDMVRGWMNSDGHRTNILNPDYDAVGVGVVHDGNTIYYCMNPFAN